MNVMRGRVVGEADQGATWSLRIRLDEPGPPAQGDWDLEVEVPSLVYEILDIARDRLGVLHPSRLDPRVAVVMTPPPSARTGRWVAGAESAAG